jgi:Flp pilus assembly protein TadD
MLKIGEQDVPGAEDEFNRALEAAKKVDPEGPREAEVLNYMALFYAQLGEAAKADSVKKRADAIFARFQEQG